MSEWYYSQANQQRGPVTWERLQQMAASGELRPEDLVWQHPMPNWLPAGGIAGLQAPAPQAPPAYHQPAAFQPLGGDFVPTGGATDPAAVNPYASPQAANSPYGYDAAAVRRSAAGWITQVTVVSILMMVQGSLECLISLFFPMVGLAPNNDPDVPPMAFFILFGVGIFLLGALKLTAGIMNFRFRGRILGFVAVGSSLASLCTCYCFPTALALGVYGLIVLLNEHVAAAFALGSQGLSREQIIAQYR